MAWILPVKHKDGTRAFWIMDRRDGRFVSIPGGKTEPEAKEALERYLVRRDLQKEGYDDGLD